MNAVNIVLLTIAFLYIAEPVLLTLFRLLGVFAVVNENEAQVYVLFGHVLGVVNTPGLHFLWAELGLGAIIVNIFGQCHVRDLRLDQEYIRSNPVNSEEGAPMGIGVWYEMFVSDPVAHVFRNLDPRGSLCANVSSATVRCLSNMKLADMLDNRHTMSATVRKEVTTLSKEWGYELGSVYIRKVHFRDGGMVRQIEEKVVNRLRQVTSAIRQDGANTVNIIASTAEKDAATEFARAAAIRSQIVGAELRAVAQDKDVAETLFEILETRQMIAGKADIVVLPPNSRADLLTQLSAEPRPTPTK
jgi:regulator of protease activity HflC (stomatin/prohibitin superfamily)